MNRIEFETAKLAKQAGLDQDTRDQKLVLPSHGYHKSGIPWGMSSQSEDYRGEPIKACPQVELQEWLREKKGMSVWIDPHRLSSAGGWAYNIRYWDNGTLLENVKQNASDIDLTYPEAMEEGLRKGLELIIKHEGKGSKKVLNTVPETDKEKSDALYNIAESLKDVGEALKINDLKQADEVWELEDKLREVAYKFEQRSQK